MVCRVINSNLITWLAAVWELKIPNSRVERGGKIGCFRQNPSIFAARLAKVSSFGIWIFSGVVTIRELVFGILFQLVR
jgi:hypothetical protein